LINEIINAEEQFKIKRENKKSLEIFPFNDAIFSIPKKKRVKKIKCDECGNIVCLNSKFPPPVELCWQNRNIAKLGILNKQSWQYNYFTNMIRKH
jgi:hypothetical protein